MAKPIIILDLDNCIANDAWRIPFINWGAKDPQERYHVYHALAHHDENNLDWVHREMREHGVDEVDAYVLTARPVKYHRETKAWLDDHMPASINVVGLLMRNDTDHRHSVEIKRQQMRHLQSHWDVDFDRVIFAADDRHDVVEMFRTYGVNGIVRAAHDVCAYTPPGLGQNARSRTVPEVLRDAAATYEERNATYGNNWLNIGPVLAAMHPDGVTLRSAADFMRFHFLVMKVVKMTRLASSGITHQDSAHDLSVYAAMLESFNESGASK
jgi:hypothetical protein